MVEIKGKKFYEMTKEELSAAGKKGAAASIETKRRKKAMKETLEILLAMPLKDKKYYDVEEIKNFAALKGKNIDGQTATKKYKHCHLKMQSQHGRRYQKMCGLKFKRLCKLLIIIIREIRIGEKLTKILRIHMQPAVMR